MVASFYATFLTSSALPILCGPSSSCPTLPGKPTRSAQGLALRSFRSPT